MAKRIFFVLLTVLVLSFPLLAQTNGDGYHYIKPTSFDNKAMVLVSGKQREYYLLEQGKQVELKIQGPSRLKVLSRVVLASDKDSLEYSFLALRKDSRKTVTFTHKAGASDKASVVGQTGTFAGVSRTKLLEIPKGEQVYTFYLPKDSHQKVLLRFALETNEFTTGTPVAAMTPVEFTTQVDLVSGEKIVPYYRIGTGYKVALKLIGPATLKVLSRIEFDASMTGQQKWKVQAIEDGKVKGTYALSAPKSDTTAYKEKSALVASRAETFFVEVPAGEHHYEFILPENHRTVLTRFLLPKNQLAKD
jgi:hypothetical protein